MAVIFVVGFFGLGLALTIATIALVGLNKNYNTTSGNQTFYTAESAAREGAYQLVIKNASYPGGNFQKINNATGTISIATSTWNATVTAVALNNLTNRTIIYQINYFPAWQAFSKTLYSGDSIAFPSDKSMKYMVGETYAQNNISDIDKIKYATSSFSTSSTEYIPMPIINRDDLVASADYASDTSPALETYIENNCNIFSNTIIFASGTAPLTLQLPCTLEVKALIVEGDFNLIGIGGDVSEIKGLVYVEGTTIINVNGANKKPITGSLISLGSIIIDKGGTGNDSGIYYDEDIASTWKDLLGPTTPSGPTFSIVNWQEQ